MTDPLDPTPAELADDASAAHGLEETLACQRLRIGEHGRASWRRMRGGGRLSLIRVLGAANHVAGLPYA